MNDCIEVDDSLSQLCNITENDNNLNWAFDEIYLKAIEKYVFFIERKSKDNIVNYYEIVIFDICRHCNVIILSGKC